MAGFTNNSSASAVNPEEIKDAMKLGTLLMDSYRARRDENFRAIQRQGYICFAIERGMGEEWVIDDLIYSKVLEAVEQATDGYAPFSGNVTGVRLIRASDYLEIAASETLSQAHFPKPSR